MRRPVEVLWSLHQLFWAILCHVGLYNIFGLSRHRLGCTHGRTVKIIQNENHVNMWKSAQTHPLEWFLRIIVITYHASDHAKLRIGIIMNRLDNAAVNDVRFALALSMLTLEAQWAYISCVNWDKKKIVSLLYTRYLIKPLNCSHSPSGSVFVSALP